MPSTRRQKAKEKRSRQSDMMSDIENLDVMLGNYSNSEIRDRNTVDQIEIDPESSRRQPGFSHEESNYRSLLNTNLSENSEITVETSRAISSEISSQMSRKLEEMKSDLNSHIMEVINSAIDEKILPSIENVIVNHRECKNAKLDLRSDGRHPSRNVPMGQTLDLGSYGRHKIKFGQQVQDSRENFPRLNKTANNLSNHQIECSGDSEQSENDEGYDNTTSHFFQQVFHFWFICEVLVQINSKIFDNSSVLNEVIVYFQFEFFRQTVRGFSAENDKFSFFVVEVKTMSMEKIN